MRALPKRRRRWIVGLNTNGRWLAVFYRHIDAARWIELACPRGAALRGDYFIDYDGTPKESERAMVRIADQYKYTKEATR